MMVVNVEDSRLIKYITVSEKTDIPKDTPINERYQIGKDARARLLDAVVKAIEPYIEIEAYTPCGGEYTTKASLAMLNAKELKVRDFE
jgi:hypothetical protein